MAANMHIAERISSKYLRHPLPSPARFGLGDSPAILIANSPHYIDPPPMHASSCAIAIVREQLEALDATTSTACDPESNENEEGLQNLRCLVDRVRARLMPEQSEDPKFYNGVRLPRIKIVFDRMAAPPPGLGRAAGPQVAPQNPSAAAACGAKRKRGVSDACSSGQLFLHSARSCC